MFRMPYKFQVTVAVMIDGGASVRSTLLSIVLLGSLS